MSGVIPEIVVFGTRGGGGGFSLGDAFRFAINNSSNGQSDGSGGTENSVEDETEATITFSNGVEIVIDLTGVPENVKAALIYLSSHLNEFPAVKQVFDDLAARGYSKITLFTNSVGPVDPDGNLIGNWANQPGFAHAEGGELAITFNGTALWTHQNSIETLLHEVIHGAYPTLSESATEAQAQSLYQGILNINPDVDFDGFTNSVSGQGSSGNNHLGGDTGHDHLSGENGNDSLFGNAGDDFIEGGAGSDDLFGNAGNDILIAGSGTDDLFGGSGNDQYIFDNNLSGTLGDTSGNDLIEIEFTSAITFAQSGNSLVIDGPGSGNALTIFNWFSGQEIEVLRLANNTVLSSQDINQIIDFQNGGGIGGLVAPIVFDLDGDGVELVNLDEREVKVDWDGDGKREYSGWVGPDDGLLFYDQNGNDKFDDSSEITFTQFLDGAKTDLEGLAGLDDNGDGKITDQDAVWDDLFIWQDTNQNGKSNKNELFTLDELGIVEISLISDNELSKNEDNIVFGQGTYTTADGVTHILADAGFRTNTSDFTWQENGDLYNAVSDFYG